MGIIMKKVLISLFLLAAMLLSVSFGGLVPAAMAEDAAASESSDESAQIDALLAEGLGYWYGTGEGGYDKAKALDAFRRAAAAGSGDAYYYLGMIEGNGARAEREEHVLKYYQKAAELGSPLGLYGLGRLYASGSAVRKDTVKAKELFDQAIAAGCQHAWIGVGHLLNDVEGKGQEAAACYEQLLDSPDWLTRNTARCAAAYLYLDGADDLDADTAKAFSLFMQAAVDGYIGGLEGVGNMYYAGNGIEEDGEKAFAYFSEEAEHGSYYDLGFVYLVGFGVEEDYAKAAELFQKDMESGRTPIWSMHPYAYMLAYGLGMEQDEAAAAELCRRGIAADVDDDMTDYFLSLLEDLGESGPEERSLTGVYELTAVMNGGEKLTPEQAYVSGSILLRRDGTALLTLNGSEGEMPQWTEEENSVTLYNDVGDTLVCPIEDGVMTVAFGEGYDLLFSRADAIGEASLLFPIDAAIDPEAGVHLRYTRHTEYMDALSDYDVHTKGDMLYSERLTKVSGMENRTADCYKDGTAYTLHPDEKTGVVATTYTPSTFAGRMALIDDLYSLIHYAARRTDYTLEIRLVEDVPYVVEHYSASTVQNECAFYFNDELQLVYVAEEVPSLGESFYTLELIDEKVDESLFDLSGYTIG